MTRGKTKSFEKGFMGSGIRLRVMKEIYKVWRELPDDKKTAIRLSMISGISLRKVREEYLPIMQEMEEDEFGKSEEDESKDAEDIAIEEMEERAEEDRKKYLPKGRLLSEKSDTKVIRLGNFTKRVPIKREKETDDTESSDEKEE